MDSSVLNAFRSSFFWHRAMFDVKLSPYDTIKLIYANRKCMIRLSLLSFILCGYLSDGRISY